MNYKFKVGDLVKVPSDHIGLVTGHPRRQYHLPKYTILIGGDTVEVWEYELGKVNKNEVSV